MTRQANKEAKRLQLELPYPFGHAIDDNDVWEAVYSRGMEWSTRKQIADALGRSVHPALVARIERLVTERKLEREIFTLPNKAQGYKYRALESGE
jgi:hypothetical protein